MKTLGRAEAGDSGQELEVDGSKTMIEYCGFVLENAVCVLA